MLRDKNRVTPHGRLPAIVGNDRRRLPPGNQISGVLPYCVQPFLMDIINLRLLQVEPAAKPGIPQPFKELLIPLILRHLKVPRQFSASCGMDGTIIRQLISFARPVPFRNEGLRIAGSISSSLQRVMQKSRSQHKYRLGSKTTTQKDWIKLSSNIRIRAVTVE